MFHRYWDNFSTLYLLLQSILLGTDSNPMIHEKWQSAYFNFCSRILKIKMTSLTVIFFAISPIFFKVPECRTRFPSTGPSFRVKVNCKQLQYIRVLEYRSRFPSTGPGSQVQVQVPKYRSRFPSTGHKKSN